MATTKQLSEKEVQALLSLVSKLQATGKSKQTSLPATRTIDIPATSLPCVATVSKRSGITHYAGKMILPDGSTAYISVYPKKE